MAVRHSEYHIKRLEEEEGRMLDMYYRLAQFLLTFGPCEAFGVR